MNERKLREIELDAKTAGDNVEKLKRIARADVPVLVAEIRRLRKSLDTVMDRGLTYALTTTEHHLCAEGMYRVAEEAING